MTLQDQLLVGREAEQRRLEALLGEVRGEGAPRFAVVAGEPGIGKSSLLAALARRAEREGCVVLDGRATELERELPFGLFIDALDAHLDGLDARAFDRIAAEDIGELATVFPSLRTLAREDLRPPTTVAERFRTHFAVRALLERLALVHPAVLLLDDVHWSDGASTELIGHLLRRPPDAAVLFVLASRARREPPALVAAARAGRVERIELGPLDPDDARVLLQGTADDELLRESGGNPFYLLQLARRDGAAATRVTAEADAEGVPSAVTAAIDAELDALSERARRFVGAAAVAGDPFELDVAVAASGLGEEEALGLLDDLIAADVVRAGAEPRRFRFRHPLVRRAIYAGTAPGARLVAHERAAEVLAARDAPSTSRAHHVERSARHGDLAAVAVLREAATEVAARAPASATRWLRGALRVLPASADPSERVALLAPLAEALAATGRLAEAREVGLEAIALTAPDTPASFVSACANLEQLLGRHEEARERLLAAHAASEPGSTSRGALQVSLGLDGFVAGDYTAMARWAERAAETTAATGNLPLAAAGAAIRAFAEAIVGPPDAARRHCDETAAMVDAMSDAELAERIDAIAHLCGTEYVLERFDDCTRHGERGLAVGRATGQGDFFPTLSASVGGALFSAGRLAEAAVHLDAAVEAARITDNRMALGLALLNSAYDLVTLGDVAPAVSLAEEAVAVTDAPGGLPATWAGVMHAYVLLEEGRPGRAVDLFLSAGGARLERVPGGFRCNFLDAAVQALLELDRIDQAQELADEAVAHAGSFGLRIPAAGAQRARARVLLRRGDVAAAAEAALSAAASADDIGARVEAGVSRVVAGSALIAAGRVEEAAEVLRRAAEELDRCGARRHRERAERELRRIGRGTHRRSRPPSRGDTGLGSLTGREREIADLVLDRRTNPEIAAELFLSIKTVETHMRNVMRKLGVSSRVEVARVLERAGRDAP